MKDILGIAFMAAIATTSLTPANAANEIEKAGTPQLRPSAFDYKPQGDDERGLWMQMDEEERSVKTSKFLITDPALNTYVRGILCRTVGESRCGSTRIYIMRTPQFNAMMAPNGMMIVWSGLLLRARNEAELATVLGHEFGHFENQHSLQSFRDLRAKTDAMAWLSYVPYVGMIGQIGLIGSVFEFNRDMEQQADMVALNYMADSGYDPMAASDIWEQLRAEMDATAAERSRKSMKDRNGGFFATHPNSGDRMNYLRAAALKKGSGNYRSGAAEYRSALRYWWPKLIDDQIKLNDFGATDFLLQRLAKNGWTGELLYARGELFRARGKEGDFDKAAEFYQQSINTKANIAESWRGLGLALLRSGKKGAGQKALREYLLKSPNAPDKSMIAMMAGAN
jgi:beta-barrel assembly-enhancing protease